MPMTDELGNLILRRMNVQQAVFTGGYFEMWLSRLAEPQPDLRDDQNYLNRARFQQVTDALFAVMTERQLHTLKTALPWWLLRLLGVAHASRMTLLSFNYDTLVEHAVNSHSIYDWEANSRVLAEHVLNHTPPWPPGPGRYGTDDAASFRLLKLHGSLDTFWVPGDRSGSTINRSPMVSGSWTQPEPIDQSTRRRDFPGRSPYIVPPAAAKSAFYDNPISRELWQSAAEALADARRVVLIGYSLPPTDLVTSGMLAECLNTVRVRDIVVVNPRPQEIVERLAFLGVDRKAIRTQDGSQAVEDFVNEVEGEAAKRVLRSLATQEDDVSLIVGGNESRGAVVTGLDRDDTTINLRIGELQPFMTARYAGVLGQGSTPCRIGQLKSLIGASSSGLTVSFSEFGPSCRIIDTATWSTSVGAGDGRWLVLIPSALPTS
jgi:hypothetical protein